MRIFCSNLQHIAVIFVKGFIPGWLSPTSHLKHTMQVPGTGFWAILRTGVKGEGMWETAEPTPPHPVL